MTNWKYSNLPCLALPNVVNASEAMADNYCDDPDDYHVDGLCIVPTFLVTFSATFQTVDGAKNERRAL